MVKKESRNKEKLLFSSNEHQEEVYIYWPDLLLSKSTPSQGNLLFWYWRTTSHLPRRSISERHDAQGTWLWVHACNVAFPLFRYQSSYILYKLIINMSKAIQFLMNPRIVSLKFLRRLGSTRNYWKKSYLTDDRTNRRQFVYFNSR